VPEAQLGKARCGPCAGPCFTRMNGREVAIVTQFVGIAEFLGLAAGEVNNHALGSTVIVGCRRDQEAPLL